MRWRARLFFAVIQEGVCLFALFLGLRLDHLAQSKAQTMEHRRPGPGRGPLRRPIPMIPERLSPRPRATVWRPHPKTASAIRAWPPQYFKVLSASKARLFGPVHGDAARRRSAIGEGLSDG